MHMTENFRILFFKEVVYTLLKFDFFDNKKTPELSFAPVFIDFFMPLPQLFLRIPDMP